MFAVIENIINYNQSQQYMSTYDQYCIAVCCALILILTLVTAEWLRQLFKSLINKIR